MNFIRKLRENLKDPKKKSITLLGIYAVFFILVFILIKMGESSNYNYENIEEEKTNDILNYEYIYRIYDNEDTIEVYGTYKNNIDTFNYGGLNYTKKDDIIYLDNTPVEIDFNIDRYKYNTLQALIENSDSETKYKDSNKIVYNININKYFELLNQENICDSIDCTIINVPITVQGDEFINNVIIDLSNYYGYRYNIEIEYKNFNNLY